MKTDFQKLSLAGPRLRRLYGCACYQFVKSEAASQRCDDAVKFALNYDDMENVSSLREHFYTLAMNARESGVSSDAYKREIARNIARIVVTLEVKTEPLLAAVWGCRGHLGWEFDAAILDDLGIDKRVRLPHVTEDMLRLAREIYDLQSYESASILADAGEDAGASEEWISHLRTPGGHWKGCWAIDIVLGKGIYDV